VTAVKNLRCLMLNVDVGAGHRLAALALREAIEALRPGSRFEIVEALDYLGPRGKQIARDLYLGVQESTPDLWGLIYEQRSLLELFRPLSELVDDWRAEELLPKALRFNPQLVIATHPVACGLGAGLRRGGEIVAPLVAVVTDYDGHPAWVVKGVDLYLAATPEVARQLERCGAPAGSVAATGIPLRGAFTALPSMAEARQRIGVDAGRLTVLLLGGGLGLGPVLQTAEALVSLSGPLQLVLIAGNNEELRGRAEILAARSPGTPLHVRGYVENMVDYLAAADVAVSKPGAADRAQAPGRAGGGQLRRAGGAGRCGARGRRRRGPRSAAPAAASPRRAGQSAYGCVAHGRAGLGAAGCAQGAGAAGGAVRPERASVSWPVAPF